MYEVTRFGDLPKGDSRNEAEQIQDYLNEKEADGFTLVGTLGTWPAANPDFHRGPVFILHKPNPGQSRVIV